MSAGDPGAELPILTTEPMALQSRQMLMIAAELGLLTYRRPVNMAEAKQALTLREDLGEDLRELPQDAGVYYFVYVNTDQRVPEIRNAIQGALDALPAPHRSSRLGGQLEELANADPNQVITAAFQETAQDVAWKLDRMAAKAGPGLLRTVELLKSLDEINRRTRVPVLIREGEVRGFVAGLAVKAGREAAERLRYYVGMLPA
jgi:hypothetical protein